MSFILQAIAFTLLVYILPAYELSNITLSIGSTIPPALVAVMVGKSKPF